MSYQFARFRLNLNSRQFSFIKLWREEKQWEEEEKFEMGKVKRKRKLLPWFEMLPKPLGVPLLMSFWSIFFASPWDSTWLELFTFFETYLRPSPCFFTLFWTESLCIPPTHCLTWLAFTFFLVFLCWKFEFFNEKTKNRKTKEKFSRFQMVFGGWKNGRKKTENGNSNAIRIQKKSENFNHGKRQKSFRIFLITKCRGEGKTFFSPTND